MSTKKLWVHGRLVGEVETTGDAKTDLETVRRVMAERGLSLKEPPKKADQMFNQALAFATTSKYLYDTGLTRAPRNQLAIAPFVVNLSFAIELYLKCLAMKHGVALRRVHELLKLLNAMPASAAELAESEFAREVSEKPLERASTLRECIERMNDAFVNWRYVYEKESTDCFHVDEAIAVGRALHEACRKSPGVLT